MLLFTFNQKNGVEGPLANRQMHYEFSSLDTHRIRSGLFFILTTVRQKPLVWVRTASPVVLENRLEPKNGPISWRGKLGFLTCSEGTGSPQRRIRKGSGNEPCGSRNGNIAEPKHASVTPLLPLRHPRGSSSLPKLPEEGISRALPVPCGLRGWDPWGERNLTQTIQSASLFQVRDFPPPPRPFLAKIILSLKLLSWTCSPVMQPLFFLLFFSFLPRITARTHCLKFRIFCSASVLFPCSRLLATPTPHPKIPLNPQWQDLKSLGAMREMNSASTCLSTGRGGGGAGRPQGKVGFGLKGHQVSP